MAYLVIHSIQHGRPGARKDVFGDPILEQHTYQPGDSFEPSEGDDVPALLASGVLAENNADGRARLAAREAAMAKIRNPYGLL